jgi:hypothetical protein
MKSDRRHEFKENTLDKVLTGAPDIGRKYGGMLLLVVLAAVVGYMLIRYRINSTREAHRAASENLATARTNINQLGQLEMVPVPAQQKAEMRKRWADDARAAIDAVSGSANDPTLLAEALLAKGDLNWTLAHMKELPEAATQPALRLQGNRDALLGEAESAYAQVVTGYGEQKLAVVAAQLGLAAVYEDNGAWDKAKQNYQILIDDPTVAEAYKTQARIRLEKAADWSQPVLLAAATQPGAGGATPSTATSPAATSPARIINDMRMTTRPTTDPAVTRPIER